MCFFAVYFVVNGVKCIYVLVDLFLVGGVILVVTFLRFGMANPCESNMTLAYVQGGLEGTLKEP